jgi:hypothetical protein
VTILRDKKQQTLTLQVDSKHKQGELLFEELCPAGNGALVAEIDPKQMEQLKQQMEQFRKSFKAEDFKVDPKQMEELKRQMEEFRKNFKLEDFQRDPMQ